jgi:hypothetical protein
MAKDKNSFLIYCDVIYTVEKLTDEQAGALFKHLLRYVNDQNPVAEDIVTEIAFEPIKQSLKRDLNKYESIRERNRENANKRWNATASDRIPKVRKHTKNADSVSDSVSDINIYRSFAQLSISKIEFEKLSEEYTKEQIDSTLDEIENYKDNKKYKSLYLTAKKWLSKNYPTKDYKTPLEELDPLVRKAIELGYEKY